MDSSANTPRGYSYTYDELRLAHDAWHEGGDEMMLQNVWKDVREYGFPFKRSFMSDDHVMTLYHGLVRFSEEMCMNRVHYDKAFDVVQGSAVNTDAIAYISIGEGDYELSNLTDMFTEPARMDSRCVDKHGKPCKSPAEAFSDAVPYLVDEVMRQGMELTPRSVREAVWTMPGTRMCPAIMEPTTHSVTKVVSLFKMFRATRVLDPCAGWGDRLIAAIVSGMELYRGFDPNPDLVPDHARILRELPRTCVASVESVPFEDAVLRKGETFDLVYTSPPYGSSTDDGFPLELYGGPGADTSRLSASRYKGKAWMDWLMSSLVKAYNALVPGGHLAIHISDHRKSRIVGRIQIELPALTGAKVMGVVGMQGHAAGPPRPVWVFRKPEEHGDW